MIATVRQLVFFHHLSHCLLNIHSARMCFQHPLFLFSASSLKRPSSPSPRRAFVSRRSSLAINITIILSSVDFVVEQRRRVGVDATPTAHAQLRRYGGHSHRQRTWRPLPQTAHVDATPTAHAPLDSRRFITTLLSIPESRRGAWWAEGHNNGDRCSCCCTSPRRCINTQGDVSNHIPVRHDQCVLQCKQWSAPVNSRRGA